ILSCFIWYHVRLFLRLDADAQLAPGAWNGRHGRHRPHRFRDLGSQWRDSARVFISLPWIAREKHWLANIACGNALARLQELQIAAGWLEHLVPKFPRPCGVDGLHRPHDHAGLQPGVGMGDAFGAEAWPAPTER